MKIITGENNKILRSKSQPVKKIDAKTKSLVSEMKKIIEKHDGVGLAAIQVGIPLRIVVCKIDDKFYSFINPEIVKFFSKKIIMEEGCLSLPGVTGEVERPEKILIKALTENNKILKIKVFGLLARILQHEIDHLDGILFIDKAKNIKNKPA